MRPKGKCRYHLQVGRGRGGGVGGGGDGGGGGGLASRLQSGKSLVLSALLILLVAECSADQYPYHQEPQEQERVSIQTRFSSDVFSEPSIAYVYHDDDETMEGRKIYKNPRNAPSESCPRDEQAIARLGRTCLRKCSADADCLSRKKVCLCDGICGLSCIKPDKECGELDNPMFGSVEVKTRLVGSQAMYTCQEGYHLIGQVSRQCQANGIWSSTPPECRENLYCTDPPVIPNARHNGLSGQTRFEVNQTLQFSCYEGYDTEGFDVAKCFLYNNTMQWFGPEIRCNPKICGDPGEIPNGFKEGSCFAFSCRVTYHCRPGFELVGRGTYYCQHDGTWNPRELPTCAPVQCEIPENPENGKAIFIAVLYNAVVSYECSYGYMIVGSPTRRCGPDKKWSGIKPLCKQINCGHPGQLSNGWLENIEQGTSLGASIIFRCYPNMTIEGDQSTVCQADGTWSKPPPMCLAPCIVPTIEHGQLANDTRSGAQVSHGMTLDVKCNHNYELTYTLAPCLCYNGTWTHYPRCQPARCKRLPRRPRHGMVIAPKTDHGMRARYRCKDGFQLEGNSTNKCHYGTWVYDTPTCKEVYCPFPGEVAHGRVLLVGNMGMYDYRSYVKKVRNNRQIRYDCLKGFYLVDGPPGATCVAGRWSPKEMPKCIPDLHPRIRWVKRSINGSTFKHFKKKTDIEEERDVGNETRLLYQDGNGTSETNYSDSGHRETEKPGGDDNDDNSRNISLTVERKNDMNDNYTNVGNKTSEMDNSNDRGSYEDSDEGNMKLLDYDNMLDNEDEDVELNMLLMNFTRVPGTQYGLYKVSDQSEVTTPPLPFILHPSSKENESSRENDSSESESEESLSEAEYPVTTPTPDEYFTVTTFTNSEITDEKPDFVARDPDFLNKIKEGDQHSGRKFKNPLVDFYRLLRIENGSHELKNSRGRWPSLVRVPRNTEEKEKKEKKEKLHRRKNKWKKKGKKAPHCEAIPTEPYLRVEIARPGRDSNYTYSAGVRIKVTCMHGYGLNIGNKTAKCARGSWKPKKPECITLPCSVQDTAHGQYDFNGSKMPAGSSISHGEVVKFTCQPGYNILGSSLMRCWYGTWAVTGKSPECQPDPCVLPELSNAKYTSGYKKGLTISHGATVEYSCDEGFSDNIPEVYCHLGSLRPSPPNCVMPGRPSDLIKNQLPPVKREGKSGASHNTADLIAGQDITVIALSPNMRKSCSPPPIIPGALIVKNGYELERGDNKFPDGTHLTFTCNVSNIGDKTAWNQTCMDGTWQGAYSPTSCGAEGADEVIDYGSKPCTWRKSEPNVVTFYNDQEVTEDSVNFQPGALLVSRCVDIGKYAMNGSVERRCIDGQWSNDTPVCVGLSQEHNYSLAKPPTILFRNERGRMAQSNDGKMVVYPGTLLHLECLFTRRHGTPKWNVSLANTFVKGKRKRKKGKAKAKGGRTAKRLGSFVPYPNGWANAPNRNMQLEYRLSIYKAQEKDSGAYACVTPLGRKHIVHLLITRIDCPNISTMNKSEDLKSLRYEPTDDTRLGTYVKFSCEPGSSLVGSPTIKCLPSGNWSAPVPRCENIECPDPRLNVSDDTLVVTVLSRGVGGRVEYTCPSPARSSRHSQSPGRLWQAICQDSGQWSSPPPNCQEDKCTPPAAPENGIITGQGPFHAGDVVEVKCDPNYMIERQELIVCQEDGRWSVEVPKCLLACTYPGTIISGTMSAVKFYYPINENITYTCSEGFELQGARSIVCREGGKWSAPVPSCMPAP